MGIVRMGPPAELILQLQKLYQLDCFIETGTYYGSTAAWAASHFKRVVTIEYSKQIYEETAARYANIHNISFLFGDSRLELQRIVSELESPAIFWLDSHWSRGETYGETDECPLLEEIRAINTSEHDNFIFIDDARLFMSPPPKPHHIEQWPSIAQVIYALNSSAHKYYIVIFEDVIITVPEYAKELVANYCQEVNTRAWSEYGKSKPAVSQGCGLIGQGLILSGRGLQILARTILNNLIRGFRHR